VDKAGPALALGRRLGHDVLMSSTQSHRQTDLFGAPQPDLFANEPEPVRAPRSYEPSPSQVRTHLEHILTQARSAVAMPWDARKAGFYKTVVPQMTLWLPEDEAAQWRLDFDREIERLEAAA
jgi:hypothetical protein